MRTFLLPLQIDSSGRWATTNDPDTILRQQIIDILVTNWGERVMLPEYGANLNDFLFAPILNATLVSKGEEIRTLLTAKISFGEILSVTLSQVADAQSTIEVHVSYRLMAAGPVQTIYKTFSGLLDEETVL